VATVIGLAVREQLFVQPSRDRERAAAECKHAQDVWRIRLDESAAYSRLTTWLMTGDRSSLIDSYGVDGLLIEFGHPTRDEWVSDEWPFAPPAYFDEQRWSREDGFYQLTAQEWLRRIQAVTPTLTELLDEAMQGVPEACER
jgi:hypothetical protein